MNFRTIFVVVLCLLLVASIASPKIKDGWQYEIPKVSEPPVVDGNPIDGCWKAIDWNFARSDTNGSLPPDDWADLCLVTKICYDDDNLYALYYVQDENVVGNDAAVPDWQRNDVELYIDPDNSKDQGPNLAATDYHISMRHEYLDQEIGNFGFLGLSDTNGVEWKMADGATTMLGWWMEIKIPLANLGLTPTANSIIGLEYQSNDNDGNGRDHITKWWELAGDSSWQFASAWGTGYLGSRIVDHRYIINKLPSGLAITVDGDADPIYQNANSITPNCLGNGSTYPYDFMDAFYRTTVVYDDDNLYVFFHVYDDEVVGDDAAQPDWQRNDVEFYIDPNNSKDAGPNLAADDYHISMRHEYIDQEIGNFGFLGLPDTNGVEWKIKDVPIPSGWHEAAGYNVELKVPLANLGLTPTMDAVLGFEAQMNDNDGSGRESILKWWEEVGDSSWQFASAWGTAVLGPVVEGTGVKTSDLVINNYRLSQNYPNPFNPSTQITFTLAKSERVKLSVYNLLGKEVAVLVNGMRASGPQTVTFNAKNLASGVYFYKLEAGSTVLSKKMLLLK